MYDELEICWKSVIWTPGDSQSATRPWLASFDAPGNFHVHLRWLGARGPEYKIKMRRPRQWPPCSHVRIWYVRLQICIALLLPRLLDFSSASSFPPTALRICCQNTPRRVTLGSAACHPFFARMREEASAAFSLQSEGASVLRRPTHACPMGFDFTGTMHLRRHPRLLMWSTPTAAT